MGRNTAGSRHGSMRRSERFSTQNWVMEIKLMCFSCYASYFYAFSLRRSSYGLSN